MCVFCALFFNLKHIFLYIVLSIFLHVTNECCLKCLQAQIWAEMTMTVCCWVSNELIVFKYVRLSRLPQVVSCLLEGIGAVLDQHSGPAVLEAAARTYLSLCGEETSWCSVSRAARDSLAQRWVDELAALLEDSLQVRCTYSVFKHHIFSICAHLHDKAEHLLFFAVGWQLLCWRREN